MLMHKTVRLHLPDRRDQEVPPREYWWPSTFAALIFSHSMVRIQIVIGITSPGFCGSYLLNYWGAHHSCFPESGFSSATNKPTTRIQFTFFITLSHKISISIQYTYYEHWLHQAETVRFDKSTRSTFMNPGKTGQANLTSVDPLLRFE